MNLCSDHHDEVCYDVRACPLCAKMTEMDDALDEKSREIKILVRDMNGLQATIVDLQHQIDEPLIPAMERAQQHPAP